MFMLIRIIRLASFSVHVTRYELPGPQIANLLAGCLLFATPADLRVVVRIHITLLQLR